MPEAAKRALIRIVENCIMNVGWIDMKEIESKAKRLLLLWKAVNSE
jgi:hypothetical protein